MTRQSNLPKIIPPRSVVRLIRADRHTPAWKGKIGMRCRVNYYLPRHGLKEINLVDDEGCYFDAVDMDYLKKYFRIERLSKETDYFGVNRRPLGPIRRRGVRQDLRTRVRKEKSNVCLSSQWASKILTRLKWPIAGQIRKLRGVFERMGVSRRKQPPFYFFVWPDKMRINCFKGSIDRLLQFLSKGVTARHRSLRQAVEKREIADWQILIITSLKKPDYVWVATHRIHFVTGDKYDIWPEYAIQRVTEDKYLVWKWKPPSA